MRIYGTINRVEQQDDGTLLVSGIASSGKRDTFKTVITPEAMRAAIPDYMKFANVREMHRRDGAAGVTESMAVNDDGMTEVCVRVVDDSAIKKCLTGVYKGFSIGAINPEYNADDKLQIDRLKLVELSLVDRPSNPDAVFDVYRVEGAEDTLADGIVIGDIERAADAAPVIEAAPIEEAAPEPAGGDVAVERVLLASGDTITLQRGADGSYTVVEGAELTRGSYSIGELARLAESLECFASSRSYDSGSESSSIPDQARKLAGNLYDMLLVMVGEDVAVAKTRLKDAKRVMDGNDIERAALVVAGLGLTPDNAALLDVQQLLVFRASLGCEVLLASDLGDIGTLVSDLATIERLNAFIDSAGTLASNHEALKVKWAGLPAVSPIDRVLSKDTDRAGAQEEEEAAPATPLDAIKRVHEGGGTRIGGAA